LTDIDKLLRSSLNEAAEAYDPIRVQEARREFLRRARRRRIVAGTSLAFGGAALIALFLVVGASDLNMPGPDRDEAATGIASAHVSARVKVGDAPRSVAVAGGSVWVANSGDGTLSRIDLQSNEVIDTVNVGGTPTEMVVAGGSVWMATEDQPQLTAVDADTLEVNTVQLEGDGTNLDLVPAGDFLWAVSPDTPLQRIDATTGETIEQTLSVEQPVDMAVGDRKIWVLGAEGAIDQVDRTSGLGSEATFTLEEPLSPTASDLAFDGLNLWLADGDSRTIARIDPHEGVVTGEIDFQGRWVDLASSDGRMWALVGNDSNKATLMLLEGDAGIRSAGAMQLGGGPVDIVTRGSSVWAANAAADSVTRIDLDKGSSSPPVVAGEPIPENETVYIYSYQSDMYASTAEPKGVAITGTSEVESNPSYLSDDSIIFERSDVDSDQVSVVTRDLLTGVEGVTPISGTEVSIGPRGRAAWVETTDDSDEQTRIRLGALDGSGRGFLIGNPEFDPLSARNLEWGSSGDELFYEAGTDEMGLYAVDYRSLDTRAIDPTEPGAAYLGPSADEDGLVVLRVCCGGPGFYETVELGRLSFEAGAPEYSKIAGLDDAGFNPNAEDVTVEYAGGTDVEEMPGDRIWSLTSDRAWIVSDGHTAWLVDERGEIDRLFAERVVGLAVNPKLLD
jgi:YVTN family beta-propeller protein